MQLYGAYLHILDVKKPLRRPKGRREGGQRRCKATAAAAAAGTAEPLPAPISYHTAAPFFTSTCSPSAEQHVCLATQVSLDRWPKFCQQVRWD